MATPSLVTTLERATVPALEPAIKAALERVTFPMAVYDLAAGCVVAANQAFGTLVGVDPSSILGLTVSEFLTRFQPVSQHEEARRHFNEVATHRLAGYQTTRRFFTVAGEAPMQVWLQRLDVADGHDLAVNIIVPLDRARDEPAPEAMYAAESSALALVVTDHDWRVEHSSSDVKSMLGYEDCLVGTAFLGVVHPADAPHFLLAVTQAATSHQATIVRARLKTASGAWQEMACFVSTLCAHDPPRLGIMMATRAAVGEASPAGSDGAKLEQHLWRIGLEVRAAGFLPEVPRSLPVKLPAEFAELSSRQWEIVTRLVRGERVPDIARAMFLSPSTVRNHLTMAFRKFGVHSQAALLAKLRETSFPGQ